jgi:D-tyrosyl-tRNA(Tyr) deacylase
MRIVLQRVSSSSVTVDGREVARIGRGLLLLIGIEPEDGAVDWDGVARKIATLRIFPDEEGKMNRSVEDVSGELLLVSQFTLCADTRKGRRPSFVGAAPPELAEPLFDRLVSAFRDRGFAPQTGVFGARMSVSLINEGPVTLLLDVAPAGGMD